MKITRRAFLRALPAATVALALPLSAGPVGAMCTMPTDVAPADVGSADLCGRPDPLPRAAGDPPFEAWWVKTFLPTKTWATASDVESPIGTVVEDRYFRVDAPQRGFRLFVWDPRKNQRVYVGSEAVGPADPPIWADFSNDARWIDVNLTPMQHLRAMQGDEPVFRDLVTAGLQGRTQPGFYRIMRRVYNETMDSRTVPDATRTYLLKNVLYTQYFLGDGSAIHYNWWASTWGYPGSQGCLGMRMDGARYMWEWATIGTPLLIHH